MSEELIISGTTKEEKYATLIPQIEAMAKYESDSIALMANIAASIMDTFKFLWVGFYRVIGNELVLGPFQGPLACTRIRYGKGVCGTAWAEGHTVLVDDVDKFPGHIACSSLSKSEIVVPFSIGGKIAGVLDIDSAEVSTFDSIDRHWLEMAVKCLELD